MKYLFFTTQFGLQGQDPRDATIGPVNKFSAWVQVAMDLILDHKQ